jgi:hypothetical protein
LAPALILLATNAALAAPPPPAASPKVVQSLLDCRKIQEDAARLACYDKATADVASATASGDLVSIDREQRKAARRQSFGFALPTLSFLDHGEKGEDADRITATAKSAYLNSLGQWVVVLEDGAVWRQTEVSDIGRQPRAGSKVVISRGALGSFFMTIDGQGAGRAKRES